MILKQVKNSCTIILFFFLPLSLFSQDTSKFAFAVKPFAGAMMFPSPTLSYPSPQAGLTASAFVNFFEIELGAYYYRKYDLEKAPNVGSAQVPVYNYQSVSFVQDYLNITATLNIKMTHVKNHIISGYFGFAFRKQLSWSNDTLHNDASHVRNEKIKTKIEPGLGVSLLGGFRYTYSCNKFFNLVTGVDAGISIEEEFTMPAGLDVDQIPSYPKPLEPKFQLGLSLGFQFMLSKKKGRYFVPR